MGLSCLAIFKFSVLLTSLWESHNVHVTIGIQVVCILLELRLFIKNYIYFAIPSLFLGVLGAVEMYRKLLFKLIFQK